MLNRIEKLGEYEEWDKNTDVINLLINIKEQVYDVNKKKYPSMTMVHQWKNLCRCKQFEDEDLIVHYRRFVGCIEAVEIAYGNLKPKGDNVDKERSKFIAALFMDGADKKQYGSFVKKLEVDYSVGKTDVYPDGIETILQVLILYSEKALKRKARAAKQNTDGKSFAQGGKGRKKKCWECGSEEHMRSECAKYKKRMEDEGKLWLYLEKREEGVENLDDYRTVTFAQGTETKDGKLKSHTKRQLEFSNAGLVPRFGYPKMGYNIWCYCCECDINKHSKGVCWTEGQTESGVAAFSPQLDVNQVDNVCMYIVFQQLVRCWIFVVVCVRLLDLLVVVFVTLLVLMAPMSCRSLYSGSFVSLLGFKVRCCCCCCCLWKKRAESFVALAKNCLLWCFCCWRLVHPWSWCSVGFNGCCMGGIVVIMLRRRCLSIDAVGGCVLGIGYFCQRNWCVVLMMLSKCLLLVSTLGACGVGGLAFIGVVHGGLVPWIVALVELGAVLAGWWCCCRRGWYSFSCSGYGPHGLIS